MGVFGLGSLVLLGVVYFQMTQYLDAKRVDWLSRELVGRTHSTAEERITHLNSRLPGDPDQRRPYALLAPDGHILAGSMVGRPKSPAMDRAFSFTGTTRMGRRVDYVGMAHRLPTGETLLVAEDAGETEGFSGMITGALLTGLVVTLLVGLAGAIVLGRSSARRIDEMRVAIERIVAGDLSERLPVSSGRGDIERLAAVVNGMLDELERMVGEVKAVCDNLAHDMRTPLARLLAGLERALRRQGDEAQLRGAIDGAVGEIKDILRVFAALLRISELEDGVRRAGFAPIDLVEVAADAVDYYRPLAESRGIELAMDAPTRTAFDGDPQLLFEAVANLLDNAIKFSGEGQRVRLSIRPGPVIEISDNGPGIPVEERPKVLSRFQRGEASRSRPGNGLGLPLVAAIAQLHGLKLRIGDSSPGCLVSLAPTGRSDGLADAA